MYYDFKGQRYPAYITKGNASSFILPFAKEFCKGKGLDIGGGRYPFPGATNIDIKVGRDAMSIPTGPHDFIFSSHCLEHLEDPAGALYRWTDQLKDEGVLFLYLPHPDAVLWWPEHNPAHLHILDPVSIITTLSAYGYTDIMVTGRDLYWSFAVVARKDREAFDRCKRLPELPGRVEWVNSHPEQAEGRTRRLTDTEKRELMLKASPANPPYVFPSVEERDQFVREHLIDDEEMSKRWKAFYEGKPDGAQGTPRVGKEKRPRSVDDRNDFYCPECSSRALEGGDTFRFNPARDRFPRELAGRWLTESEQMQDRTRRLTDTDNT